MTNTNQPTEEQLNAFEQDLLNRARKFQMALIVFTRDYLLSLPNGDNTDAFAVVIGSGAMTGHLCGSLVDSVRATRTLSPTELGGMLEEVRRLSARLLLQTRVPSGIPAADPSGTDFAKAAAAFGEALNAALGKKPL